ncbi:MAG: rhodanese-like domain-containing protein [Kiritimatiellales bacterium]|nr:rhodanese-like domain-containing protein [Pontiella sp.]NNJ71191.1 rhodanese-like domain-containing protein [Kiritimatiellales bacterium]
MNKLIKLVMGVLAVGLIANFLFGGGVDKDADIPQLIKDGALVIDTRTAREFSEGHIDKAVNIPFDIVDQSIGRHATDKSKPIVVYCRSGARSGSAKKSLESMGYTRVVNGGGLHRMHKLLAE